MELASETRAVSTFVAVKSKESPAKSIKLEIGKWYDTLASYGDLRKVKIVSLKLVDGDYVVSYKYVNSSKYFGLVTSWSFGSSTINGFKNSLVDYGKVNSVEIYYPVK